MEPILIKEFTLEQQLEILKLAENMLIKSRIPSEVGHFCYGLCYTIESAINATGYLTKFDFMPKFYGYDHLAMHERIALIEPFKRINAMQFGAHPTKIWWWGRNEIQPRIDFLHWMQEDIIKRMGNGR